MSRFSSSCKSSKLFLRKPFLPSVSNVYTRNYAKAVTTVDDSDDISKPITFSTSDAGWKKPKKLDVALKFYPWYKELILWGSYIFFVTYFLYFRPKNDRDEELEMPLGKRLLKLREEQIMREKNVLRRTGNTGASLDDELRKINSLRKKYNYVD